MHQKKSTRLFVVFWILFIVIGMAVGGYTLFYTINNNLEVMDIPSQDKLAIGVIILLVFDPILFLVSRYAKKEHNRIVLIVALFLLCFITTCVLSEIISLI